MVLCLLKEHMYFGDGEEVGIALRRVWRAEVEQGEGKG